MERITFSVGIRAPRNKIWRTLLEDATYRQWTSAFAEGSYAVTDWSPGSEVKFLTPSGEGMRSRIVAHRPEEFLSIEHLGALKNGVADEARHTDWAGAREDYCLRESDGISTLTVEADITSEYRKYFEETWPKALEKLKELAEAGDGLVNVWRQEEESAEVL